ncbi:hypothetical protein [Agarivorans sp. DSG3-1]|uniref:hypothetical protein n=1 Tax=Agarivorans sp. DSG3-1 TaxID=3342249 RepID=UPI00398E8699
MKKFILVTVLLGLLQPALATANELFPQEALSEKTSLAYQTMSSRYTAYAQLFNGCQNREQQLPECQEPFQKAQTAYIQAKSNYDTIEMMEHPSFKALLAPSAALPELASDLNLLGYLDNQSSISEMTQTELLYGLNQWLQDNRFPKTDQIYLLHSQLVSTERLAKQTP